MSSEYDHITAFHYRSYRPPLHSKILKKCITDGFYDRGLDIGCGTGQSSIALSDFCNRVFSIDSSMNMISNSIFHSKISYSHFNKTQIDFEDECFDIITLAGSLWYAKSQQLLDEIVRVGNKSSRVLVYDFQVFLDETLGKLGFVKKRDSSGYDHQENFLGLNTVEIKTLDEGNERMHIQMTVAECAHLVLSVKEQYSFLEDLYGSHELFNTIEKIIGSDSQSKVLDIQADTFFTLYLTK